LGRWKLSKDNAAGGFGSLGEFAQLFEALEKPLIIVSDIHHQFRITPCAGYVAGLRRVIRKQLKRFRLERFQMGKRFAEV